MNSYKYRGKRPVGSGFAFVPGDTFSIDVDPQVGREPFECLEHVGIAETVEFDGWEGPIAIFKRPNGDLVCLAKSNIPHRLFTVKEVVE